MYRCTCGYKTENGHILSGHLGFTKSRGEAGHEKIGWVSDNGKISVKRPKTARQTEVAQVHRAKPFLKEGLKSGLRILFLLAPTLQLHNISLLPEGNRVNGKWFIEEAMVNEVSPSGDYLKLNNAWYPFNKVLVLEILDQGTPEPQSAD